MSFCIVVVLGFEQPTYTVSEEDDQLMLSVNVALGSLEKNVVISVETAGGSASGCLDFFKILILLMHMYTSNCFYS